MHVILHGTVTSGEAAADAFACLVGNVVLQPSSLIPSRYSYTATGAACTPFLNHDPMVKGRSLTPMGAFAAHCHWDKAGALSLWNRTSLPVSAMIARNMGCSSRCCFALILLRLLLLAAC